jgi:hypothetical protein
MDDLTAIMTHRDDHDASVAILSHGCYHHASHDHHLVPSEALDIWDTGSGDAGAMWEAFCRKMLFHAPRRLACRILVATRYAILQK